jgi:hypothetical protein
MEGSPVRLRYLYWTSGAKPKICQYRVHAVVF